MVDHESHTGDVLRSPRREHAVAEDSCRKETHNMRQTDQRTGDRRGSHHTAHTGPPEGHGAPRRHRHADRVPTARGTERGLRGRVHIK